MPIAGHGHREVSVKPAGAAWIDREMASRVCFPWAIRRRHFSSFRQGRSAAGFVFWRYRGRVSRLHFHLGRFLGAAGIALGYRGAHLGAIRLYRLRRARKGRQGRPCGVGRGQGRGFRDATLGAEDRPRPYGGPTDRRQTRKKGWRERAIVAALMSVPPCRRHQYPACGFIKIPRSHFFVAALPDS